MASSLANYLNNRNAALISMLVLLVLFGLTAWQWTWWSGAIENNGKDYRIALKFDESNAAEFPYSIKTQQGKMYAKGNITTPDKLLTDDNIDGSWLAIRKVHEEYRSHVETYSCNCLPKKGCSVCTRTVWNWEFDRNEDKVVPSVSLLGQTFDSGLFGWKSYKYCKIKESKRQDRGLFTKDDTYIKISSKRRYYYETVDDKIPYEGGFVSDQKGVRADSSIQPSNDNLSIERIFITILMIVGSLALTYDVFTSLRQVKDCYDS